MQRKHRNRIFSYVASAFTVAVAAALVGLGAPAASAAPRVINVDGIITGFTPKTINVTAGEEVSICLKSPDTDHDLTIPTVNNFQVIAPTGAAVCKTLTAPDKAGTHEFICSVPGHEAAGMVGSLVVAAPGAAVPTTSAAPSAGTGPQAGQVPAGGAQSGDGPTAGLTSVSPLMLGGGLLIAALMSALLGYRVARRD